MMNAPIRRHPALIKLSREHNGGLMLALVLKKDTPAYRNMPESPADKAAFVKSKYQTELHGHFKEEEELLFPFVTGREKEIDDLIAELRQEHKQLREMIDSVDSQADLVSALDDIGCLLEAHIRKEERRLFNMIQETLSGDELNDLEQKFN